ARPAFPAVARSRGARPQPHPRRLPREAAVVEPRRLVAGEPCRQDLALPGPGRRLESFELREHGIDGLLPLHARRLRAPAPGRAPGPARPPPASAYPCSRECARAGGARTIPRRPLPA